MPETPKVGKWKRQGEYLHHFVRDGVVLATVEKHPNHMSGHFSLWVIHGEPIHEPTLRDAKARVEKRFAATPEVRDG